MASATCGNGCNPAANFPSPNDRSGGTPQPYNGPVRNRQHRRQRFFSERLNHISAVAADPASITLREFAVILFVLFTLYHGYFAADRLYDLLARRDVGQVCLGATALQCLRYHVWHSFFIIGWAWAAAVLPWGVVGAVAVFFIEEFLIKARSRLGKA